MPESGDAVTSTREVAEKVRRMVEGRDGIEFADLFAPDGVLEYPFAAPGQPQRLEGREAIRAFHGPQARQRPIKADKVDATVHETIDPEVVIVEIEHRGTSLMTGRPYHSIALGVIRVRDGEILSYRDYMNPIALAAMLGRTPTLVAALSAEDD
jgi:uncharacterized protein